MNNSINFNNDYEFEAFEYDGKILLNLKQVCQLLNKSYMSVLKILNNTENMTIGLTNSDIETIDFRRLDDQGEIFITESGLYYLLIKTNNIQLQKWFANKVLPRIREQHHDKIKEVLDETIEQGDFTEDVLIRELLNKLNKDKLLHMLKNKKINGLFTGIINKNLFEHTGTIYKILLNNFIDDLTENEDRKGKTIIIVSEDKDDLYDTLCRVVHTNKNIYVTRAVKAHYEYEIKLNMLDSDKDIRFSILDINNISENSRSERCECLIIDLNNPGDDFGEINNDVMRKILLPMNSYAKIKPCHGTMLFYKK